MIPQLSPLDQTNYSIHLYLSIGIQIKRFTACSRVKFAIVQGLGRHLPDLAVAASERTNTHGDHGGHGRTRAGKTGKALDPAWQRSDPAAAFHQTPSSLRTPHRFIARRTTRSRARRPPPSVVATRSQSQGPRLLQEEAVMSSAMSRRPPRWPRRRCYSPSGRKVATATKAPSARGTSEGQCCSLTCGPKGLWGPHVSEQYCTDLNCVSFG